MAEEMVVIDCDKCGAKLKVRAIALKILKDIKCGKCGTKVLIKKDAPVQTDSTPIPVTSSVAPPNPPAPAGAPSDAPAPKPVASSPPAPPAPSASGEINDLGKARDRIKQLEERVTSLLEQASQLSAAKTRIANLEMKMAEMVTPGDKLATAQKEIHEQSERISELQQLWMQKEKETREAFQLADKAKKERLDAVADRERTIVAIKEVLTTYHINEIESAKKRMSELDQRIQNFLSMTRTPTPPG